jgi:site-specific recombinase XerD
MKNKSLPTPLARAIRGFFADHLPRVRGMSAHTIHSYRDSMVLLLRFVAFFRRKDVAALEFDDIGPDEALSFLDHLEETRRNAASTRNVRLAAVHAFFRYVAAQHPDRLEQCQRILGIPFKRSRSRAIDYLELEVIQAILSTINRSKPTGRRDYALIVTMFNTGARVHEVVDVRANDLQLVKPFQVLLRGKGGKTRTCPLWPQTAALLRDLCAELAGGVDPNSSAPVFRNRYGTKISRFGVLYVLRKYIVLARVTMPTLAKKRLHPHSMRHSTAVHLLKSGVDIVTVSHWLGHASITTTNRYAKIDLEMKRQALARMEPLDGSDVSPTWRTDSTITEWLESL